MQREQELPFASMYVRESSTRSRNGLRAGGTTRLLDYVRQGTCPEHNATSIEFAGINEYGWVFKCKGEPLPDAIDMFPDVPRKPPALVEKQPKNIAHYFVNQPPKEAEN